MNRFWGCLSRIGLLPCLIPSNQHETPTTPKKQTSHPSPQPPETPNPSSPETSANQPLPPDPPQTLPATPPPPNPRAPQLRVARVAAHGLHVEPTPAAQGSDLREVGLREGRFLGGGEALSRKATYPPKERVAQPEKKHQTTYLATERTTKLARRRRFSASEVSKLRCCSERRPPVNQPRCLR